MASVHKHIRSGTASKRPTTAIAEGQIALATNIASPGLFFKDSTGATIVKIGPVHVGATAPNATPAGSAGNSIGEVWLDTSLTPIGVKIYDGTAFVNATPIGSTTVQGLLELATDAETQTGADTARAITSASLQSKLSDSTSTTSNITIASSTAVKAAYDLANAALPKTGGTVTGNLEIGTAGSLTFEGATADGFETTIAVVDPTADRTITLPNTTGTVVTTGDTGTVTSTMLLDGTIVDADINAAAAIAYSKLATLTSGNLLVGNGSNVATSVAVTGDVTIGSTGVTAIAAGVIVNADVNASAAIAGTKIAPDFGAQNIATTGSSTAATFNPTGTTPSVTGIYSPGANRLGITTNSVERVEFGASEVVFNDDAADYDFRIEGDTNSNLFFADASAEAVGIRTATPVSELNVSVGNGGNITISNTNDAHSAGLAFGDTTSNSSGRISYDHSTNALAVATNGTQRATIDSSGRLLVGTSTARSNVYQSALNITPQNQIESNKGDYSGGLSLTNCSVGGYPAALTFGQSFTDTLGGNALITNNQLFGLINFTGNDGTNFRTGAQISALVDGTSGAGDMPGRLVFSTTADGAATTTERMRITSAGLVGVGTSSPNLALHVSSGIAAGINNVAILKGGGSSSGQGAGLVLSPDSANTYNTWLGSRVATAFGGASWGCDLILSTNNNSAADNLTERMRITSAGLVGIGVTSPGFKLQIAGSDANHTFGTAGTTKGIRIGHTATLSSIDGVDHTLGTSYQPIQLSGSKVLFAISDSEKAQIDSSGRLLVGTSSHSGGALLQVKGKVAAGTGTSGTSDRFGQMGGYQGTIIANNTAQTLIQEVSQTFQNATIAIVTYQNDSTGQQKSTDVLLLMRDDYAGVQLAPVVISTVNAASAVAARTYTADNANGGYKVSINQSSLSLYATVTFLGTCGITGTPSVGV